MAKQPRIVVGGLVGYTTGMWWSNPSNAPSENDIDADNDGVLDPIHEFSVDLSRIASRAIGYQASMMAGYKLHRIKMGIRPVDDINDNDMYASFGIALDMYPATDHAKKALGLARRVEKADEAAQVDGDSLFLTSGQDYSGFRYGWNAGNSDTPVFTTNNSIAGMSNEWLLSEIFDAYDSATEPVQSNAMFGGRAPEQMTTTHVVSWTSGAAADAIPGINHYRCEDSTSMHSLEILPLLRGQVKWSTGDEAGAVDDDFRLWVEVEFTPEAGGVF